MKTLALNSLLVAAIAAVLSVNLPQAAAQSCHAGRGYYPVRQHYPVRHQAYYPAQQVHIEREVHVHQEHIHQELAVPADAGMQLIDLRLVDPGAPGQAGPKIRVVFQNASPFAASAPFDIVLAAAIGDQFAAELPLTGQRVTEIAPGQTAVVDLRLPPASLEMQYPGEPRPAPFQNLIVMIAQSRDLQGQPQLQQLAAIPRLNLQLVDMQIDPAAQPVAPSGAVITLSGEGFGTQPGQALLAMGGLKLAAEIVNWSPQGVQVRLPQLALAEAVAAEVTLVRADNAVAGMALQITPAAAAVQETVIQETTVTVEGGGIPAQGVGFQQQQQGFNPQQQQGFNPQQQGQQQQGFNPLQQQQQVVPQQGQAQQAPGLGFPGAGQGPVR